MRNWMEMRMQQSRSNTDRRQSSWDERDGFIRRDFQGHMMTVECQLMCLVQAYVYVCVGVSSDRERERERGNRWDTLIIRWGGPPLLLLLSQYSSAYCVSSLTSPSAAHMQGIEKMWEDDEGVWDEGEGKNLSPHMPHMVYADRGIWTGKNQERTACWVIRAITMSACDGDCVSWLSASPWVPGYAAGVHTFPYSPSSASFLCMSAFQCNAASFLWLCVCLPLFSLSADMDVTFLQLTCWSIQLFPPLPRKTPSVMRFCLVLALHRFTHRRESVRDRNLPPLQQHQPQDCSKMPPCMHPLCPACIWLDPAGGSCLTRSPLNVGGEKKKKLHLMPTVTESHHYATP